jgi:hypothetical protein
MSYKITIEGFHAELATAEQITLGIVAAREAFARNEADPLQCAAAVDKMEKDELLSKEEALLCLIWDEAEEAAFKAVTHGWLSRDVDVKIAVHPVAAESAELAQAAG